MADQDPPQKSIVRRDRSDQPLFRSEAIAEQQTQWLGTVLLAPSLSHKFFAWFAFIAMAAVLSLMFFADYTRKERISGWLVPEKGLIRIFAPHAGVITELHVKDGDAVDKGAPLLVMSTDVRSEIVGATQEEVVRRLQSRRASMLAERDRKEQIHSQAKRSVEDRLLVLQIEKEHRDRELDVQRQRIDLATENVERLKTLRERGLIAGQRWQQVEDDRLDHLLRLEVLERERAEADQQWLTLRAEQNRLPLQLESELAEVDRNIDALDQELAEAEAKRRIVLAAPEAGTVTVVQAEQGGSANPNIPLLNLIPAGSKLEAQLFIPSRARGFIKPGQKVLLRYQAFPYQKFGHHEGKIRNIARSAITPGEMVRQLQDGAGTNSSQEPVYPVKVSLTAQAAQAYGEQIALQPGMRLEADIQIENRRLIEWVLDPIYSLTGRGQTGSEPDVDGGQTSGNAQG